MKLGRLAEYLNDLLASGHDPEADVKWMSQPSWPFENAIVGACTRPEFAGDDEYDYSDNERKETDVFLVEGRQICYGNSNAWEAARR